MKNQDRLHERWTRTSLQETVSRDGFFWATGIEDTFVAEPHQKTSRILDEYQLTDHYARWSDDLQLMNELKVGAARYGIPWYRVNPSPGKWDWGFVDQTLEKLLALGINPIVDLVHYGTPSWMDRSFLNPDYPNYVAEYASKVATRFKGRVFWYTPLNEPRINAYYSGKLGFWPPHAKGWSGFLAVLVNICKGIVLTHQALETVDSEIVKCHVDATDLYMPLDEASRLTAQRRQEIVFLALDLVMGKFSPEHYLFEWATSNGMSQESWEWFQDRNCTPDVLGINLYPMFSLKNVKTEGRRTRYTMPYAANQGLVAQFGRMYWERYRVPLMISETASAGSISKRSKWLSESVACCKRLRSENIPMLGYTWWPMFSLVAWSYLRASTSLAQHIVHMGLWDLDAELNRISTPLVNSFASLAGGDEFPKLFGGKAYLS